MAARDWGRVRTQQLMRRSDQWSGWRPRRPDLTPVPEGWSAACLRLADALRAAGAASKHGAFVLDVMRRAELTPRQLEYFRNLYEKYVPDDASTSAAEVGSA